MMNKFFVSFITILILSIGVFTQTKSLTEAQNEIKTFANSQNFSVIYDSAKYVTKAEVKFDILEKKTSLANQFKEFGFKLTSLFATDGIDTKPVRTTFCINTRSKRFFFSSNRNLKLTLDGEPINLGEGDRSTEVKSRKIRENVCWGIDKEIVKDLGNASNIQYQIGRMKGIFNSNKTQLFKDYSKLLQIDAK